MKKIIAVILALIASVFFCACAPVTLSGTHPDYAELLSRFLKRYEQNEPFEPPQIFGFSLLYDTAFDWALPFYDEYSVAAFNQKMRLIGKDGTVDEIDGYPFSAVTDGRYVFSKDGVFSGLISVNGTVIVEPEFDSVDFCGQTAVARINEFSFVYGADTVVNILVGGVTLIADNVLLTEGAGKLNSGGAEKPSGNIEVLPDGLFDCRLNPIYADGYRACGYTDGALIIEGEGGFGLADLELNALISPLYDSVQYCGNRYAAVEKDGEALVVDFSDNVILRARDKTIIYYDGVYTVYRENGQYYLADKNLTLITEKSFGYLSSLQAIEEGFLILAEENGEVLYSIERDEFCLSGFKNISVNNGIITAQEIASGRYSVFDYNFYEIAGGLTYAQYSNGVLMIETQEKYIYYV